MGFSVCANVSVTYSWLQFNFNTKSACWIERKIYDHDRLELDDIGKVQIWLFYNIRSGNLL